MNEKARNILKKWALFHGNTPLSDKLHKAQKHLVELKNKYFSKLKNLEKCEERNTHIENLSLLEKDLKQVGFEEVGTLNGKICARYRNLTVYIGSGEVYINNKLRQRPSALFNKIKADIKRKKFESALSVIKEVWQVGEGSYKKLSPIKLQKTKKINYKKLEVLLVACEKQARKILRLERKIYLSLKNSVIQDDQMTMFNKVIELVDDITENNGVISFKFTIPDIVIEDKSGVKHLIGTITVKFSSDGKIKFENQQRINGYRNNQMHPHIWSDGSACFGSYKGLIDNAIKYGRWLTDPIEDGSKAGAINLLTEFCLTVTEEDSAGRHIIDWPIVQ